MREAIYTGLGHGRYRFHVLAANSDGVWNEEGAALTFEIPPMFYETRTFLALCIAAALGSLWLLYRSRMQRAAARLRLRLEERHAERERIARELHDTLLQGFQGLVLRFQAAAESIPSHEPARRMMEQTLDRADDVLTEGRDRIRDLRAAMPALDLTRAMSEVARKLAEGDTAFRVLTVGAARPLDAAARDEVYWIGREALANAFRHARARQIEVHVVYESRALRLRVCDDGCGIDAAVLAPDGKPGHWGLRGMRERAARIGATLEVQRAAGGGTEVEVAVPAASVYRDASRIGRWLRVLAIRGR
jgi:signal transduction histidine kinase